ncbi:hypothetical protein Psta_4142 [Pirellula staleyi DSM 6068]|uniref:Uncharacterized protein n=1 Tax=Pirellula staleyi (strain ATCC 27377 / DSM 6068 / ICPB 4128) TaxID=530564 RepID=D2R359_PIRSD|nr:RING finger protein [Pirellula staleyi]ADB18792.1 hypothetical protein Psta_4142 [Pirellula staleyi DSM 6068]
MNDGPVFGFFLFIAVIIIIFVVATLSQQQAQANLQQVVRKYRGKLLYAGGFFSNTKLSIQVGSTQGELEYVRRGKVDYMVIRLPWPEARFRCQLQVEDAMKKLGKLMGMQDIQVGNFVFDDLFMISGEDERAVRELLTPSVQHQIVRLYKLHERSSMYSYRDLEVTWMRGLLAITKPRGSGSAEIVSAFIDAAADLYEAALGACNSGIEIISEKRVLVDVKTACPVCSDELSGALVQCTACKTSHHRDCWSYFGSCATYGCGSKRCRNVGGGRGAA